MKHLRKYPIIWKELKGLPGCFDHDHENVMPEGHAIMIQQVNAHVWRVLYTYPFSEFLKSGSLKVASEGSVSITYSTDLNQVTVSHVLGSFNRCRIAARFYIESFMEDDLEKDMESTNPGGNEAGTSYSL